MRIFSMTDVGQKRSTNQDAFYAGEFDNGAAFAVVCDGMGGANAGNVASQNAASIISDYIVKSYSFKMNAGAIETMLRAAVESANSEIYELSKTKEEYSGMGTTAVVAFCVDNLVHIVHVGDSRAYLIGTDEITQLTVDHSVVQSMVESGEIDQKEAKNHPNKNIITRALGAKEDILCDYTMAIKPENFVLLICTDGLSNFVDDEIIFNTVQNTDKEICAEELVKIANNGGGNDNITVVLVY